MQGGPKARKHTCRHGWGGAERGGFPPATGVLPACPIARPAQPCPPARRRTNMHIEFRWVALPAGVVARRQRRQRRRPARRQQRQQQQDRQHRGRLQHRHGGRWWWWGQAMEACRVFDHSGRHQGPRQAAHDCPAMRSTLDRPRSSVQGLPRPALCARLAAHLAAAFRGQQHAFQTVHAPTVALRHTPRSPAPAQCSSMAAVPRASKRAKHGDEAAQRVWLHMPAGREGACRPAASLPARPCAPEATPSPCTTAGGGAGGHAVWAR